MSTVQHTQTSSSSAGSARRRARPRRRRRGGPGDARRYQRPPNDPSARLQYLRPSSGTFTCRGACDAIAASLAKSGARGLRRFLRRGRFGRAARDAPRARGGRRLTRALPEHGPPAPLRNPPRRSRRVSNPGQDRRQRLARGYARSRERPTRITKEIDGRSGARVMFPGRVVGRWDPKFFRPPRRGGLGAVNWDVALRSWFTGAPSRRNASVDA
jgi:hypothetical protein